MSDLMESMSEADLIGKTITEVSINGYCVLMTVDDGTTLYYDASDGGYSMWEIYMKGADDGEDIQSADE